MMNEWILVYTAEDQYGDPIPFQGEGNHTISVFEGTEEQVVEVLTRFVETFSGQKINSDSSDENLAFCSINEDDLIGWAGDENDNYCRIFACPLHELNEQRFDSQGYDAWAKRILE